MARTITERDLAMAAWLSMNGINLSGAWRTGDASFEFLFEDPDDKAEDLRIAFANSDCAKFDSAVRMLKKLTMNGRTGKGRSR